MKITINDAEQFLALSYEEIVERAGKRAEARPAVVWRSGDGRFDGELRPGEVVEMFEGMVFSVSEEVRATSSNDDPEFAPEEPPTKDESPRAIG